jgi:predicted RNA-binding protein associated with RNAse of E/G family
MGDEQMASHSPNCLCLMLYELRDDLAELLFGLESGQMTREQVVAGAKAELEQVLKALSDGSEGSVCLL